jgi:amidase
VSNAFQMNTRCHRGPEKISRVLVVLCALSFLSPAAMAAQADEKPWLKDKAELNDLTWLKDRPSRLKFHLEEATIADIQWAIRTRQLTATELVHLYLKRIKAYNGVCVNQPQGILGPITTIPNAGQINALMTLNLRPDARRAWGFEDRKARSMTDLADTNPAMPDALEVAAELDRKFAETGKLVGPLHGVVMAIKDQYDTFDMRTTSGADAFYANDRPPDDATFVKRLRDAGAIILAKANMGEYASGDRSSFGGTHCLPYDTERAPGGSSGGSGSSVSANLVTCAIGEESGPSIRWPSRNNSIVGLPAPVELVSRDGLISHSLTNDRVGPMCRTVKDAARVLEVIAGFDPKDQLTAFSIGRLPSQPYHTFANEKRLDGIRIGVVREYMDKSLFTQADFESIDIVDRAINDLRTLGATIIDPGPGAALFQSCVDKYVPSARNRLFIGQFPSIFPAGADHIPLLLDMFFDPSLVPHTTDGQPSIRNLGPSPSVGGGKYFLNHYLRERGDANIKSITDLIEKSNFFTPVPGTRFTDKKAGLISTNGALTLDLINPIAMRYAYQQTVLQCMAELNLDAVTYPTGNIPAVKLGMPVEPEVNNRPLGAWAILPQNGFSVITVPAGFTTHVYDRDTTGNLVGPIEAKLPVGIDFLGRPFGEPMLFRIASAYEAATHHRVPPPAFGPLQGEP